MIDHSGSAANFITITAYGSGDQPVLTNPGGLNMLKIVGAYVAVDNLAFTDGVEFDNSDSAGITGPKYENSGAIAVTSQGTGLSSKTARSPTSGSASRRTGSPRGCSTIPSRTSGLRFEGLTRARKRPTGR